MTKFYRVLNKEDNVCDEQRFKLLFTDLAPLLRNFLNYKYSNLELARDMVQEAFSVLWKNCEKVQPAQAKAYLFRVAQNQMIKYIDKEKIRNRHLELQTRNSTNEDPAYAMEYNEFQEALKEAIQQLPDGQREVFLLNRIDKKKYREIAVLLDISEKAVEKRMSKAMKQLKKSMEGFNVYRL